MNFHQLLQQRAGLLHAARLANLAFAYARLQVFAARIADAGIAGPLALQPVDPEVGRFCPVLAAHACSQAVIDEHFLDEDVVELADILAFLREQNDTFGSDFAAEDLAARFLPWLRRELERAGVGVDEATSAGGAARAESAED